MMTRIFVIAIVIYSVAVGVLYLRNMNLKSELSAANGQITELNSIIKGYQNEIQKYNRAQERASEKIEKVRTVVRTVKSECDCYNTAIPDDVRRLLNGSK